MRGTTVASVTERNHKFRKYQRNQLLRSLFDRYNLLYPTTRPHGPSSTRRINKNIRNTAADAYEAPSQNAAFLNERSYYTPHSTTTSSFAQRYALTTPYPHCIATASNKIEQLTRTEHFPHCRFLSLLRPRHNSVEFSPTASVKFSPQNCC